MKKRLTPLCIIVLLLPMLLEAQQMEYSIKAEYLERFTRFIEWPADSAAADPKIPFRICVIGKNPFEDYLDAMAEEVRIHGKHVEVRKIERLEDIPDCELLFIPSSEQNRLSSILEKTDSKAILTVSDTPGFAEKGVLINFFQTDSKIRFEINTDAVKRSMLRFSSRLLALGKRIKEEAK